MFCFEKKHRDEKSKNGNWKKNMKDGGNDLISEIPSGTPSNSSLSRMGSRLSLASSRMSVAIQQKVKNALLILPEDNGSGIIARTPSGKVRKLENNSFDKGLGIPSPLITKATTSNATTSPRYLITGYYNIGDTCSTTTIGSLDTIGTDQSQGKLKTSIWKKDKNKDVLKVSLNEDALKGLKSKSNSEEGDHIIPIRTLSSNNRIGSTTCNNSFGTTTCNNSLDTTTRGDQSVVDRASAENLIQFTNDGHIFVSASQNVREKQGGNNYGQQHEKYDLLEEQRFFKEHVHRAMEHRDNSRTQSKTFQEGHWYNLTEGKNGKMNRVSVETKVSDTIRQTR